MEKYIIIQSIALAYIIFKETIKMILKKNWGDVESFCNIVQTKIIVFYLLEWIHTVSAIPLNICA